MHVLPGLLVIHGKMPPLATGDLPMRDRMTLRLAGGAAFGAGAALRATGLGAAFLATTFFGAAFFGAAFFATFFTGFFAAIMARPSTRDEAATFDSCRAGVAGAKAALRRRQEGAQASVRPVGTAFGALVAAHAPGAQQGESDEEAQHGSRSARRCSGTRLIGRFQRNPCQMRQLGASSSSADAKNARVKTVNFVTANARTRP